MKKKTLAIVAIMLIAVFGTLLTACSEADKLDESVITPIHYLAQTEVVQVTEETENNGEIVEKPSAELKGKRTIDELTFLQYYIGQIKNCFIQTLTTPIYNDGGVETIRYTIGKMTSTTISEGISNSISKTESISVAHSQKDTVSWNIENNMSMGSEISVSAEVGVFGLGLELGKSLEFAESLKHSYGETHETYNAQEIAKSVTTEINQNYSTSKLEQSYKETEYLFNMSNYEKNHYYALSLIADLDVYQIIAYNRVDGSFYSTFFTTDITSQNTKMKMTYSDESNFYIPPEYKLTPITEVDIDTETMDVPTGDTVMINLQDCYGYNEADTNQFSSKAYDKSKGIYEVYGSIDNAEINKYIFIGNYGKQDAQGRKIQSVLSNFSIKILSTHDIEIVLQDMAFEGAKGQPAVFIDEDCVSATVTLRSSGTGNVIRSASGADGEANSENLSAQNAESAIYINRLNIIANAPLNIAGGNGGNGATGVSYNSKDYGKQKRHGSNGGDGGNGGTAINSGRLSLSGDSAISITGGNGGSGAIGGNGGGSNDSGRASAGNGGNGGAGGNGGSAIKTNLLNITASNIKLQAGAGGNGGNGGDGGSCANSGRHDLGGNGGNGGNGGDSGYCLEIDQINSEKYMDIIPANGGNGGKGGNGGNTWQDWTEAEHGGNGGNGGNGGCCYISTLQNSNLICLLDKDKPCAGGNGGVGGDRGNVTQIGGAFGRIEGSLSGTGGNGGDVCYGTSQLEGGEGKSSDDKNGGTSGAGATCSGLNSFN